MQLLVASHLFKVVPIFRKCSIKIHLYSEGCEGRKGRRGDREKKWNNEKMASFRHFEPHTLLPDFLPPLHRHSVHLKCPVVVSMLLETENVQQSLIGVFLKTILQFNILLY